MVGRVKELDNSWMGSNGVHLSSIWDLSIPRNDQDTFNFSLDQTIGHRDSVQPVSVQPISPMMFHWILISCAVFVFHVHQQCLIFFFWSWSCFTTTFFIVLFPSFLMAYMFFPSFLHYYPEFRVSSHLFIHSSHTIYSPDPSFPHLLVISLCISLVLCLEH